MKDLDKLSEAQVRAMLKDIREILDTRYYDNLQENSDYQLEAIGNEFVEEGLDEVIFYEHDVLLRLVGVATTTETLDKISINLRQYGLIYKTDQLKAVRQAISKKRLELNSTPAR
jgi:hypothetical protein